jgi:hypothetical protein
LPGPITIIKPADEKYEGWSKDVPDGLAPRDKAEPLTGYPLRHAAKKPDKLAAENAKPPV